MLSKTVNGVTTSFSYTNTQWQDQLTSVNGNSLSHDYNGNLVSYNGKTYTWSHGKWLSGITDGDSTYSYSYDSNGIRVSKTVNGVNTYFNTINGRILAQYDNVNEIYFQYSNDAPIGFVLNDTQYFYITNLSGDIVGITDSNGELIAEYSYDEWGKLLDITTAQENNAEQLAVAEINPLRYRGYYYDNETGMYYLQSRYYNPDLCRFISADDFEYINTNTPVSVNAYAYCINNPLKYFDPSGCYAISNDEKTDNWFEAVLKTLILAIEVDTFTRIFEGIMQIVNKSFDLNEWFNRSSEFIKDLFVDINVLLASIINTVWIEGESYIKEFFTGFSFDKIVELLVKDNGISFSLGSLISFASAFNKRDEGKYTTEQAWISVAVNVVITSISVFVPMNAVASVGTVAVSFFVNLVLDGVFNFQNGHLWGI